MRRAVRECRDRLAAAWFPLRVMPTTRHSALVAAALSRIAPYLRGFGPRAFCMQRRCARTTGGAGPRPSGLHGCARNSERVLAGYDWEAVRPAIVAALWPERARGLVNRSGYTSGHSPDRSSPKMPEYEFRLWYQYYFHANVVRTGLEQNRYELCKLLWKQWSPTWRFDETVYARAPHPYQPGLRCGGDPFLPPSLALAPGDPRSRDRTPAGGAAL